MGSLVLLIGLLGLIIHVFSSTPCTNCDGNNVTCDGVCPPRCVNVTSSGECLQCRDSRFYGKQCQHDCPDTCLNSHCQMNNTRVVCTEGCVDGKKGDNCGVNCPTACTHCERYGDGCTGQCKNLQYYGPHCRTPCPSNCTGGCNRVTGECVLPCGSCEPGYTGDKCDVTCPPNCRGGCDKAASECVSCLSGYRGKNCNGTCLLNCSDRCDKETGQCKICNPGNHGPRDVLIAAVASALVVTVLLIILSSVLVYKRKRRQKRRQHFPIRIFPGTSNPTYTSHADSMLRVDVCEELCGDEWMNHMIDEFKKLPTPDIKSTYCASLEENIEKNRYKDVLPFDATRVPLEIEEEDDGDYINASYIDGYRQGTRYVAAQGPSEQTVDDFWRMVWKLNSTKIVMVTNLVEAGKVKCERYWPLSSVEATTYGRMNVQCVEEKVYETYTLRTLAIWKEGTETRVVNQFHFTKWPDHGVPEDSTSLLNFYKAVKDTGPDVTGPLVIHCSAGVGRTGTFIALDYLLDQARNEGRVCVFNCVQHFRMKRMKMVQTKEQYILIYTILNSALRSLEIIPRAKKPVRVQCESCWSKFNGENSDGDRSVDEDEDEEYDLLWTCKLEKRKKLFPGGPKPLPDVITVVSETLPLLERGADHHDEERLSREKTEKEDLRMSWVTAL
ncbi:receptor-type tyrosine-protein phosphatase kappa-like isoform X4 [Haliotis asinina]|uniref:receptor-type tyrosine-protein phosphatase kappa-like isoform X4 n=1 Tax=Haliotis asinina TaxID=109174 RepID=UPI0035321C09